MTTLKAPKSKEHLVSVLRTFKLQSLFLERNAYWYVYIELSLELLIGIRSVYVDTCFKESRTELSLYTQSI